VQKSPAVSSRGAFVSAEGSAKVVEGVGMLVVMMGATEEERLS
jgi:hypothetical protein